jgi:hypothetical protein
VTTESDNPASRYETPREFAENTSLSPKERLRLLEEWEDDVRIRVVASEEGMTGPHVNIGLADILEATALLPIEAPKRDSNAKA